MILFIISLILICISSYLVTSVLYVKDSEKNGSQINGVIYFFLITFVQIVLSFEILSIFNAISEPGFISLNVLFFIVSLFLWNKNNKPLYLPSLKNEAIKIKNALLRDKSLIILGLSFVFFIFVTLMLCIFVPVNSYDALSYHLARVPFWLLKGNLNHFSTADMRMVVMPINSELLYAWVLLFLKEDWGLGLFSFFGYFLSIISLYNFLGDLKFCTRKKLWAVFILSSIASVLVEASGVETEIIIGGLVLSSIYLFFKAVKENNNMSLFFSALAYALAVGTKTPAIIAFPAYSIVLAVISYQYRNKQFYRPLILFFGFLTVNFVFFASFNYVLNFINYSNPMGSQVIIAGHSFFGGFKAFIANYVRFMFLMFDFSGFSYGDFLGPYIMKAEHLFFNFSNIPYSYGVIAPADNSVNKSLMETIMGPGLLGFLLFLPSCIFAIFNYLKKPTGSKKIILTSLGFAFFLNVMFLSFSVGFMVFSVRFLTFFIIISSPVLVYSYIKNNKNIFKWLIIFFSFSYLTIMSTHIAARPFFKLMYLYNIDKNISRLRERISCSDTFALNDNMSVCLLKRELEKRPKEKKVALFVNQSFRLYPIKMLEYRGWKTDFLLLEDIDKINLNKYDLIVTNNISQSSNNVRNFEQWKNRYFLYNRSVTFAKDYKIKCLYTDKDVSLIFSGQNRSVAYSVCFIPVKYFNSLKFHLIKKIDANEDYVGKSKGIMIYSKK